MWSFAHRWTIQVINDNELQGFNWEGKVQYKLIDKGRLTISTGPKSPVDWDCLRPDQRQEPSRDLLTVNVGEEEEEEYEEHPPHVVVWSGLNYVDNLKKLLKYFTENLFQWSLRYNWIFPTIHTAFNVFSLMHRG